MSQQRCSHLVLVVGLAIVVAGCVTQPALIRIGAPYDRYDHNRGRPIVIERGPADARPRVDDRTYTPRGGDFPKATQASGAPAGDGLPVANIVPVFTGVPLPLSSASVEGTPSDRDDLVDYLAAGPLAQDGVKPSGMPGDRQEAALRYKVVLDLLANPDMIRGDVAQIEQWASARGISTSKRVLDSRYRMTAFKSNGVVALYCDGFWFVLYQLPPPTPPSFSRLVVVPIATRGQDFDEKSPAGRDGRCGDGR
jgi:hypothetical protein